MPICVRQTIHTDNHYTLCIHFCWFHRHRCHVCRYQPLRRSSLGPIAVGAKPVCYSWTDSEYHIIQRLIDKWDNRAAAFFASFSFVLATLGTNVGILFLSFFFTFSVLTGLLSEHSRYRRTPFQRVMICQHSARAISISGAAR